MWSRLGLYLKFHSQGLKGALVCCSTTLTSSMPGPTLKPCCTKDLSISSSKSFDFKTHVIVIHCNCLEHILFFQTPFYQDKAYLCNSEYESIGNIVGTISASANAILDYKSTWLTAVALTMTTDHTVAIVGTSSGHLKKVGFRVIYFTLTLYQTTDF